MEPQLFGLNLQLIHDTVLLAISMFVLFFVISYLLYYPVKEMLEKRKAGIAKDLEDAAQEKAQVLAMKEEYREKLNRADKEAEEILQVARKKAIRNEQKIVDSAKIEANRILEHARTQAELEKRKAMDEVKQEIITVAEAMAKKAIGSTMDLHIQQSLLDSTLEEIGDHTWQS